MSKAMNMMLAIGLGVSMASAGEEVVVAHFGDSATMCSYLKPEQRVDALLNRLLAEKYTGQKIVNRNLALDGEFIRQFLDGSRTLANETVAARYTGTVRPAVAKIDIAIFRYGQNDWKLEERKDISPAGYSPEEFKKDYKRLIETVRKDYPGARIMLETGTFFPKSNNASLNVHSKKYWDAVRELAAELKLPLIDSNKADEEHPDKVKMHNLGHPGAEAVANHAETGFAAIVAAWPDKLPVAAAAATPPTK